MMKKNLVVISLDYFLFFLSLLYYFNFKRINYLYFAITGIVIFLTAERTALFLFIILSIFYFLIIKKKIQFIISGIILLSILLTFNYGFKYKYIDYTLMQLGVIKTKWNESDNISFRYYSKEHEDFVYTAIQIFRENIFKGSGVKTFTKLVMI